MTRKSGLGRGLGALIPTEAGEGGAVSSGLGMLEVPVADIVPNPRQPRHHFDEETLAGLTASIAEIGVLQPLLVRVVGEGGYELIAGERRWRAAKRAGLTTVPVVVRAAEADVELLEQALVENLHRDDLNAMEEAAAYQQLIEDFSLTQEQVAKRVGKSRVTITNTLRLFQLPPIIQGLVAGGQLSAGHARALLGTPDRAYQESLARLIIRDGLSVRQTEEAVRARTQGEDDEAAEPDAAPTPEPSAIGRTRDPAVLELEEILGDHLQTRVKVTMGANRGQVVVEFADLADLERIYHRMTGV